MKKFFECVLVTVCFWLIVFIGPALVILWNNLSYYVSGLGYGEGSVMFNVIKFLSQPISFLIAGAAASSMFSESHKVCAFVNCIIGVCFCVFLAFMEFAFTNNTLLAFDMIASAVAAGYSAYKLSDAMKEKKE